MEFLANSLRLLAHIHVQGDYCASKIIFRYAGVCLVHDGKKQLRYVCIECAIYVYVLAPLLRRTIMPKLYHFVHPPPVYLQETTMLPRLAEYPPNRYIALITGLISIH